MPIQDKVGNRYGKLLVISFDGVNKHKQPRWLCRCECGEEKVVDGPALASGNTKSCGCLKIESNHTACLKHGHARIGKTTSEFRTWAGMMSRCYNSKTDFYAIYGGRGITVCEPWHTFQNFLNDMGLKPATGYSIDRIDNDKGYSPDNCRWATAKQQAVNKECVPKYFFRGDMLSASEIAKFATVSRETIGNRLRAGMDADSAVLFTDGRFLGDSYRNQIRSGGNSCH